MSDLKKPDWLRIRSHGVKDFDDTLRVVQQNSIHTVCEEALCPNISECWKAKTATFLIMGNICTRRCGFCKIENGCPKKLDALEPDNVAKSINDLGIKYAVITSVTRDDLDDCGASHFVNVIFSIRKNCPDTKIEILTPDFQGDINAIQKIMQHAPDVFAHNIEIVPRLHSVVKKLPSKYDVSMNFLKDIKKTYPQMLVKTGLIVGVGETVEEMNSTIAELAKIKIDILTIGQYLAPSTSHFPVVDYVTPAQFDEYKKFGESCGIRCVLSAPLVRSSYKAKETFLKLCNKV